MKTNEKHVKEPLFHITKRTDIKPLKAWGIRFVAVVAALIVCALVIVMITSYNPIEVYKKMIEGIKITGPNGGSIFLPYAGYKWSDEYYNDPPCGGYWSSTQDPSDQNGAYILEFYFGHNGISKSSSGRCVGHSVRPVVAEKAAYPIHLSATAFSLTKGSQMTVAITSGSGSYSIKSNDENVAEVFLDGNDIIITAVNEGTASITVTDTRSLTTETLEVIVSGEAKQDITLICPDNHHPHAIDLGLSSGTKWACCNVGANQPKEYGSYDIVCIDYDYIEYNDEELENKWEEKGWRVPLDEDVYDLEFECSYTWSFLDGIIGLLFTGPNGKKLFLPAAGIYDKGEYAGQGSIINYWAVDGEISINRNGYYYGNLLYKSRESFSNHSTRLIQSDFTRE